MQKPQLVAVKWGCNSTPTPVDPEKEIRMGMLDRDWYKEKHQQDAKRKPLKIEPVHVTSKAKKEPAKIGWAMAIGFLCIALAGGYAVWITKNPPSQPPKMQAEKRLNDCIKPGNLIDDDVRKCMKGL